MRLFIALPVTGDAGKELQKAQNELKRQGVRGRFTPQENLHMTVVFLGDTEDPGPVTEIMRRVRIPRAAFSFERLTLFGDALVALFKQNEAMEKYSRSLCEALDEAGIGYDRKPFKPHITLCRKTVLPSDRFRFYPVERALKGLRLSVRDTRLTESDLSGETPKYTAVYIQKKT